jgi:iron complex outermembrane recepter protein
VISGIAADFHAAFWKAARRMASTALALAVTLSFAPRAPAQLSSPPTQPDLTDKSLEDLMNTEVTSVSKKEQKLSEVAAAIFVITQEDIRRSGATNIPDLLRMVPGLDVAQINSNLWAVSARGFNQEFSNKLLVMLDGRSVYLPTFSGVFWDVLDLPFEDIERIEVIRGPGGTTWGANAVNGVINIITKKAGETRGGMVSAGGGNVAQEFGTVQYGDKFGARTDFRVFTKYFNDGHLPGLTGQSGQDGWHVLRGGFRTDTHLTSNDELSIEGDLYTGRIGDTAGLFTSFASPSLKNVLFEANLSGGYIQSDWTHGYSDGSETALQVSYDRFRRNDALGEARQTFNIDFQNHIAWGERQDIVWGVGYRFSSSTSPGSLTIALEPPDLDTNLFSAFVQDEIALIAERVSLTVGTKLEHNYFTGFGVMPSARVAWQIRAKQTAWAAVSRALRTPSSIDTGSEANFGGFIPPTGPPVALRIVGNPDFQDERLLAYEAGYRAELPHRAAIDISLYYNDYDSLETAEPGPPFFEATPLPPHLVIPLEYENLMHGEAHGIEFSGSWKPATHWTLSPGYAFEEIHMHLAPTSLDTQSAPAAEGSTPRQWARLDSHLDLPYGLDWDANATFNSRLTAQDVPSYTRVDTQFNWHAREKLTLRIVGQNLSSDHHLEFVNGPGTGISGLVKRSAYAQVEWRF